MSRPIMSCEDAWRSRCGEVMMMGKPINSRCMLAYECVSTQSVIDMNYCVNWNPARKLNYRFMAAEAWWILTGSNQTQVIGSVMRKMLDYSDSGHVLQGAYGPKVAEQMWYIVQTLLTDRQSRQAVINIWREQPRPSKDIPCTLSMQFLIRDGLLHSVVTMRSQDLWLGYSYDVFSFSMVALFLLLMLKKQGVNVKLGDLFLNVGSQHIYDQDRAKVHGCLEVEYGEKISMNIHKDLDPDQLTGHLRDIMGMTIDFKTSIFGGI